MKMVIFWNDRLCSLEGTDRRFRGAHRLHLLASKKGGKLFLKMDPVSWSYLIDQLVSAARWNLSVRGFTIVAAFKETHTL